MTECDHEWYEDINKSDYDTEGMNIQVPARCLRCGVGGIAYYIHTETKVIEK